MKPRTCIHPKGRFIVGIHRPRFDVRNMRENDGLECLGRLEDGSPVDNGVNFPESHVHEPQADVIYEIANPFPFRGATFINSAWADSKAGNPEAIGIPQPPPCSIFKTLEQADKSISPADKKNFLERLPHPMRLALAQASTDPDELVVLAGTCCRILFEPGSKKPMGLGYRNTADNRKIPDIHDHEVFEVLVNNPHLPDEFKNVLVLKPGVQGGSEIIGEYLSLDRKTHVFEYLRRNSYIPWGHFASNMANDAVRYRAKDLSLEDMVGIRHLYYQRVYVRTADQLNLPLPRPRKCLENDTLEALRRKICRTFETAPKAPVRFNGCLWGWNFGFGSAQSGHRLHASHQMIHQQNAMIPGQVEDDEGHPYDCFSWGDLAGDFIDHFKLAHGVSFFDAYLEALAENKRTDGREKGEASLIVHQDENVILFTPKAQVSEWELQLVTRNKCANILEADTATRQSLDKGIFTAVQTLERLGAQMITGIELAGRFGLKNSEHHLLYSFIPRLPYAPGTFSEAQLRWISGCYPEDFAHACRRVLAQGKEAN